MRQQTFTQSPGNNIGQLCPILLGIGCLLVTAASAWAGTWCDNFDSIPAIFCDDMDTYCVGENDPCPGGENTGSIGMLRGVWPRTSVNYHIAPEPDGSLQLCGAQPDIEYSQALLASAPFGFRENNMGDENGSLGQHTASLVSGIKAKFGYQYDKVLATDANPLYLRFNLSGGLRAAAATHMSNGYIEIALEQAEEVKSAYMDPEVTPSDYIIVGAEEMTDCISCYAMCENMGATDGRAPHAAFPTVCQSYDARTASSLCINPTNPEGSKIQCPPPYCPEVPVDKIHQTLAIGAFALLDPTPCNCENPVKPDIVCPGPDGELGTIDDKTFPEYFEHTNMNYHLSFFDGWKWRQLKEGDYGEGATGSGDFIFGDKTDTIELWIKSNTVDIHHRSRQYINGPDICKPDYDGHWEDWVDSWAYDVPRKYFGAFNALRSGTSPGCELKPDVYDCTKWAGTRCKNMTPTSCLGGSIDDGSNYIVWDSLVLLGGVPDTSPGACCLPNGGCDDDVTMDECLASPREGTFQGPYTTCAASLCCPDPFADSDGDGDVDQADFGLFQACFSGTSLYTGDCECLDIDNNLRIDNADFTAFTNCWSGPSIPVDAACDD